MERKLSTLDFALRRKPYVKSSGGTFQSERNYLDVFIDGQLLCDCARQAGYDLVSILTNEWVPAEREKSVRRLLLREPADFPNDRRSLLVCSECGDIGCGAISIVVDSSEKKTVWRDFGYENTYEPEVHKEKLEGLGPFEFATDEYERELLEALRQMKDFK